MQRWTYGFLAFLLALGWCGSAPALAALPKPDHVVVVIDENQAFFQVIDNKNAPYLNRIAKQGAVFTNARGVTHPSYPNYFAMFAGLTNTNGDDCPAAGIPKTAPNLASELLGAHMTFAAYSESLPTTGFTGCWAGQYGQKHAPWVHFSNVPQALHRPWSAFHGFDDLATVTFVVPNLDDDMHDGSVHDGDDWARKHLDALVQWANTHNTLVVMTWDEGYDQANSIPLFIVGPMVKPGRYNERVNHFNVLRTITDMYGLAPLGRSTHVAPIADIFR